MELKKLITTSAKDIQNDSKKDELFKELCLIKITEKIDYKVVSKLFELSQIILRYKGEQVKWMIFNN